MLLSHLCIKHIRATVCGSFASRVGPLMSVEFTSSKPSKRRMRVQRFTGSLHQANESNRVQRNHGCQRFTCCVTGSHRKVTDWLQLHQSCPSGLGPRPAPPLLRMQHATSQAVNELGQKTAANQLGQTAALPAHAQRLKPEACKAIHH